MGALGAGTEPMIRRRAVIADMDGTLCDVRDAAHLLLDWPRTWKAFHRACRALPPHHEAIQWVVERHWQGLKILIVTGRDEWSRHLTLPWLRQHLPVPINALRMRGHGDFRSNVAVKADILADLQTRYEIVGAIEDDLGVTELWEDNGIPVTFVTDHGALCDLKEVW